MLCSVRARSIAGGGTRESSVGGYEMFSQNLVKNSDFQKGPWFCDITRMGIVRQRLEVQ
jgi:hypothetical protein